jgi:hypothetical protein
MLLNPTKFSSEFRSRSITYLRFKNYVHERTWLQKLCRAGRVGNVVISGAVEPSWSPDGGVVLPRKSTIQVWEVRYWGEEESENMVLYNGGAYSLMTGTRS